MRQVMALRAKAIRDMRAHSISAQAAADNKGSARLMIRTYFVTLSQG